MKAIYKIITILVITALVTGVVACSDARVISSPRPSFAGCLLTPLDPADQYKIIDPAELISEDEASGFIGTVQEKKTSEQPSVGKRTCTYKTQDSNKHLEISITQVLFFNNGCHTSESIYKSLKSAKDSGENAEGIGEEYFFSENSLNILKDGYYICVTIAGTDYLHDTLVRAGVMALNNLEQAVEKRQNN